MSMTVEEIRDLMIEADPDAQHYYSLRTETDYTVWAEYERTPYSANNRADKGWKFQVDRFTRQEFDPIAKLLEKVMDEAYISYSHQVAYDPETGYVHHLFDCEGV
jgi:hypothetical protein